MVGDQVEREEVGSVMEDLKARRRSWSEEEEVQGELRRERRKKKQRR